MWTNTKLLVILSILIVLVGSGLLWSGLKPPAEFFQQTSPTPLVETTPSATSSATVNLEGEKTLVTKVVDGDTIEIANGSTIRLIGIDTPETVDPRRPVGCFGKEASNATKSLVSGKMVILQKDVSETDKYDRLLRYIFLPVEGGQLLFVNDYLVREGYAKVLTYPPDVKYNEQFRQAEQEARMAKKGLWGRC